jgi:hypothetical protein
VLHARSFALEDPQDIEVALNLDGFALDPRGNALIGGGFRGVVDFGDGALTMNGITEWGQSAFLAKVAP